MKLLNLIVGATVFSGVVLFPACCGERIIYKEVKQDLSREENQLRQLATDLGASPMSVKKMELSELVSELHLSITNSEQPVPRPKLLSEEDWKLIRFSLEERDDTFRKIEKYEKLVKKTYLLYKL